MSSANRRPYLTATVLDQDLLNSMQDNLASELRMVVDIETPDGTIHASDRHTYVGSTFYRALLTFPQIRRTVGEWLAGEVEFSSLELSLSNVDGRFNKYLPGGEDFDGWIGKSVVVKVGLRDVASSYTSVFEGEITDVGGFKRSTKAITIIARDRFDRLRAKFPVDVFTKDAYPDLEDDKVGLGIPVIYGDWTVALRVIKTDTDPAVEVANIPAFPVNGKSVSVLAGTTALSLVISGNVNIMVDTSNVFLFRAGKFYLIDPADVSANGDNNELTIQMPGTGGVTIVDGDPFQYSAGDQFYVRVKGKDLGFSISDNIVAQAKDILMTFAGVLSGDLDFTWTTFQNKSTPAESAIANFKSRVWIQEQESSIDYVLSMLEQVRLELFIDRNLKIKLNSLHFDDFVASPTYSIKNWDCVRESVEPQIDDKNNWNRALSEYAFDPSQNQLGATSPILRNQAAIDQIGKEISKKVEMPNLYLEADVLTNLTEILKLAASMAEFIPVNLTPRSFLRDIGDFVSVDVQIGSCVFGGVPAMIRDIGVDPEGIAIPTRLWSFQMVPFPGYSPAYPGTVTGGSTAIITQET